MTACASPPGRRCATATRARRCTAERALSAPTGTATFPVGACVPFETVEPRPTLFPGAPRPKGRMRNSKTLRTLVYALLALVAVLAAPTAANAGSTQLSLMQDDAELFGERPGQDPPAAIKKIKKLSDDPLR